MTITASRILSVAILVSLLLQPATSLGRPLNPFICMYGHSDDAGVTAAFRKLIPRFTVIEGTSTDAEFIKELRAVGCIYAAHVTNHENATDEKLVALWRKPFDNNLSGRLPTKPTVHIELHDEKASAGAVLGLRGIGSCLASGVTAASIS